MTNLKTLFSIDHRRLKKLNKLLAKVNSYQEEMAQLSDEQLQGQTAAFRKRLEGGASLDSLLPEAFATVREAAKRVLGMFPYDVQVLGGIVLHQGNVAEMKTGEGKTLTATMPLYLNALTGRGAMLVTVNAYLARRDGQEMGEIFRFLGMTVGIMVSEDDEEDLPPAAKRRLYRSDIIYTTNAALGFDYLHENLAKTLDDTFLPEFHYAIIDEADAVLLDTAQTPLVISGMPRVQSNLYRIADEFILTLTEGKDYFFDKEEGEVWLKSSGMDAAEQLFLLENLYDVSRTELIRHITLALKAHKTVERDKDYVVSEDSIKLVDLANGRLLEGTRLQGGLHQAIEEKEKVTVTPEMRAMASITYQNLFLMFDTLAGMTGTGKTVEEELISTYNMEVVRIPTHRPVIRKDLPDQIYTTLPEKLTASMTLIKSIHQRRQPLLIVTGSVRMSELYSQMLLLEGIPHSLLNAQNAAREAQMISEAGQLGSVTVATNMAGRGTDIKLSPEVRALGGLAVIGTERMANERMDLQVRGRAGRQGDPGFSQFFVSLEDDLLVTFGGRAALDYFKKHRREVTAEAPKPLTKRWFHRLVKQAQEASEARSRGARAMNLAFDESVKIQRDYVYKERRRMMASSVTDLPTEALLSEALDDFLKQDGLDQFAVSRFILDNISYRYLAEEELPDVTDYPALKQALLDLTHQILAEKKAFLGNDYGLFQQMALLKAIDEAWIEEVDYLQQLRLLVSGRSTAQRNPIHEYHKEAKLAYDMMRKEIRALSLRNLMLSELSYSPAGHLSIYFN